MDDFNFYMKLAKPLALNLPDARDRTMAARWLKKLCEVDQSSTGSSSDIHVECLKLLLFAMQANRLSGIFEKPPPDGDLHEFLQSTTTDGKKRIKARDMIHLTRGHGTSSTDQTKSFRHGDAPISRSISGDMCEYVAIQEIPNFGIHGYYALSTDPMPDWWNPPSCPIAKVPPTSSTSVFKVKTEKTTSESTDKPRVLEKTSDDAIEKKKTKMAAEVGEDSTLFAAASKFMESSILRCEEDKHDGDWMKKILEARRKEMAEVDARPCWGTNRYIDRLIDESPHLVGDIDLSEVDALLHAYRDRKMRRIDGSEKGRSKGDVACGMSARRREVEMKLDMPPCASIPMGGEDSKRHPEIDQSRTCYPRKNEFERSMGHQRRQREKRQGCCTESEDNESYADYPSAGSERSSLRGGGSGSSRLYLGGEFQYNRTYETLCQDCTDHLEDDNVTDDFQINGYENERENRAD